MAAAVTDKFKKVKGFFSTTLASQKNSGAGTMSLSDATDVPTDTGLIFTVGRVDSSGTPTPSTRAIYKGTLSGTTVSNLTLAEGTDQTHAAGTVVEITWTETHWNDAVDGLLEEHNQDGSHGDTTHNSITVDENIDVADGKAIRDGNDNELVKFSQTASAVNEITVKNAATANDPEIQATGGDTNIGINIVPKGTGAVEKAGYPIDWWEELGRTTLDSAGDTITVSSLPARKYLMIRVYAINTGGTINGNIQFNNDTGNNYVRRSSVDGTADTTSANTNVIQFATTYTSPFFAVLNVINVSAQEKLVTGENLSVDTAGAGTSPKRFEATGKWANTTNQITRVDIINSGAGDYAAGSEVVVLGHN